jgi:hypothetical protein
MIPLTMKYQRSLWDHGLTYGFMAPGPSPVRPRSSTSVSRTHSPRHESPPNCIEHLVLFTDLGSLDPLQKLGRGEILQGPWQGQHGTHRVDFTQ